MFYGIGTLLSIMRINYKLLSFLGVLLFPLLLSLNLYGVSTYQITMPLTFFLMLLSLYAYRNAQIFMIVIIYVGLYFLYLIPHFYFGIQLSQYTLYNNNSNFEKVIFQFYLFYLGLLFNCTNLLNREKKEMSDIIFFDFKFEKRLILLILSFLLLLITYSEGTNIYRAANYYQAYTENLKVIGASCLFGVIPLFFLGFSYKNKKKRFFIIFPFVFLYCIFAITRGTRMVLVPYIMLLFILCFDLKFKSKYIVLLCIIGFIILLLLNMVKAKIEFKVSNLLGTGVECLISHHTDMDYICCSIFGLFEDNLISPELRFTTRIGTILESIIPPKFLPNNWKYPHAFASIIPNGGGCPMFVVLYISFFGYIGIFYLCYFLSKFAASLYSSKSKVKKIFIITVLIFSSRWISYDFHVILRFPIFSLILYFFIKIVNFNTFFSTKNLTHTRG